MVKPDYWNITDTQAFEKTGKSLKDWKTILDEAKAAEKKSGDVVAFLEKEYGMQRYWARTLVTWHGKQ